MELEECRISDCVHRFRSKAATFLICCGSDSVDAEADIPPRVENVTQTTRRAPTVKKKTQKNNPQWLRPQEQQVVQRLL